MASDSPSLDIRLCQSADLEAVWPLFLRLYEHYDMANSLTPEDIQAYVRDYVLAPQSPTTVALAFEGGTPVGLATFTIVYPAPACQGQLFMKDLFIDEASRGLGVGPALMTFLARHAVDTNCGRFAWTTETSNPRAMSFYARLGAQPVENKVYYRIAGEQLRAFAAGRG